MNFSCSSELLNLSSRSVKDSSPVLDSLGCLSAEPGPTELLVSSSPVIYFLILSLELAEIDLIITLPESSTKGLPESLYAKLLEIVSNLASSFAASIKDSLPPLSFHSSRSLGFC